MSFYSRKMMIFLLTFFFFILLSVESLAAENTGEEVKNFWRKDYRSARKYAKEKGKLLLLLFTVSDSPSPVNRQTLQLYRTNREFLQKSFPACVLLHIDLPVQTGKISGKLKRQNEQLRSRFAVNRFPAFVLVDPQTPWGTLLYRNQERVLPDELLNILNRKFAGRIKKMNIKENSSSTGREMTKR